MGRLNRGQFLAAAPIAAATPAAAIELPARREPLPFRFDRDAFYAVLNRPYAHRQISAPDSYLAAGTAMMHFSNAMTSFSGSQGFDPAGNGLHCAAALYAGRSLTIALADEMYAKYPIGAMIGEEAFPNDPAARTHWTAQQRNVFLNSYMRPLLERGVSLFVCNKALTGFASELAMRGAGAARPPREDAVVAIHDDLARHLIPGAMLVPAGVGALVAAQEARFTFLP